MQILKTYPATRELVTSLILTCNTADASPFPNSKQIDADTLVLPIFLD